MALVRARIGEMLAANTVATVRYLALQWCRSRAVVR
jgi:hypothetical protein